jgi:hypothetical protein
LPAATTLPGPVGCAESAERVDEPFMATAKYVGCPAGMTTYERVKQISGQLVRVQVRAEDGVQAKRVLDSLAYKPKK